MIRIRRPPDTTLPRTVRSALARRDQTSQNFLPGDAQISKYWNSFLKSTTRDAIAIALDQTFRFKCAYCEAVAAQDIEHFYPKSSYPNRMFRWDNFLRGCKNCNNFKRDFFPLDPFQTPLLLDPCADDPLEYFVWDFQTGAIGIRPNPAYRQRGQTTCDRLQLNLEPLREERRHKLNRVLFLLARVVKESPVSSDILEQLEQELHETRPWLGIIRQLFHHPGSTYSELIQEAQAKLPAFSTWVGPWL